MFSVNKPLIFKNISFVKNILMLLFPECKINLGLSIIEKRSDGFHNLESIMYPIQMNDILEICKSEDHETHFISSGIKIEGDANQNLVMKAYQLLQNDFDLKPVKIHLHKVIPMGAGLGGGSSDAAYTLMGLNKIFELKLIDQVLIDYAARLGSDCPFFIQSNPVLATGRGEVLENIQIDLSLYHIVIIKPDTLIPTTSAYSWVNPEQKKESINTIIQKPIEDWKDKLINDFEITIFDRFPEIGKIKNKLYCMGAIYAAMSGSGSAVFGIFNIKPDLKNEFKDCFVWQG